MTSPATRLPQWLHPTATQPAVAAPDSTHLASVAGGLRAELDDYTWATGNVRKHLLRVVARAGVLVGLDLVALFALHHLLHRATELSVLAAWPLDFVDGAAVGYIGGSGQLGAALIAALAATGNYGAGDRRRDPSRLMLGCALAAALTLWSTLWSAPLTVVALYAVAVLSLAIALTFVRGTVDVAVRYARPLRSAAARTMLVGRGHECFALLGRTAFADESDFNIVGVIDTDSPASATAGGSPGDLERALRAKRVDTVILCGAVDEETTARVVRAATIAQCAVLAVSRALEAAGVQPEVVCRHGQPFIELRRAALRGNQLFAKRALDIVIAGTALVVLGPLMLLIAAAIRLESPGPALFGHLRAGRHGRTFRCRKFRSMRRDAEEILRANPELYAEYLRNDYKLPPAQDPRITRVGRFLRASSLDELPQLWNVLTGDMSLVGPRAITIDELRHYGAEQRLFLSLRPGITGVWQVSGRSEVHYPQRTLVELGYVRNWSLGRDLGVMLRTVPAVLSRRGAY